MRARDADVVEADEAVVERRKAAVGLGTDVADRQARQDLVRLAITQLDDEEVRAARLTAGDELGLNDAVSGRDAGLPDPPLGRGQMRRVDLELLRLRVVSRGRLKLCARQSVCRDEHGRWTFEPCASSVWRYCRVSAGMRGQRTQPRIWVRQRIRGPATHLVVLALGHPARVSPSSCEERTTPHAAHRSLALG